MLELEVELVDEWDKMRPVEPRIWRRFRLRDVPDVSLYDLHDAIQDACGWSDDHLHSFEEDRIVKRDGPRRRCSARSDFDRGEFRAPGEEAPPASDDVAVRDVLREVGDTILYQYDYGDSWWHRIKLVGRTQSQDRCCRELVDGARAFRPEDAGGMGGYENALLVVRGEDVEEWDPEMTEYFGEWLGDWSPEAFDLEAAKTHFDAKYPSEAQLERRRRLEAGFGGGA